MGRSFLGGFLGALLALALVGAVMSVRGQAGQDTYRATLLRQIEQFEGWHRADPENSPEYFRYEDKRRRFIAQRPELQGYASWLEDTRLTEFCPRARNLSCEFEAQQFGPAEMRDPRYLDAYLAATR